MGTTNGVRHYKGYRNLKAAGVQMSYTAEQIQEMIRCSRDPIYFIENYVTIISKDEGIIPFEMWEFQKDFILNIHNNRFSISKLPRQVGKSTCTVSYMLWMLLFKPAQVLGILAHKGSTAREILGRLRFAYERLPFWIQQGVVTWNKGEIELENDSRIVAASTSGDGVRGMSFNFIMLDEFAFVPQNIAEEFMTATYPTISSGKTTKIAMISTPNGMNMFYKYWIDAVAGKNEYSEFEIHWSDVPIYDDEWAEETIKNIGQDQFNQEYGCEFLGSTSTLISTSKLKAMPWADPIFKSEYIKVYDPPKDGRMYITCVDTAQGQGLDSSAFSVIDITETPYKQVCVYKNNKIDPISYPTAIINTAKKYNNSWILCEINPPGDQVLRTIAEDYEYERIFYTTTRGRGGQQLSGGFKGSSRAGVSMSLAVKIKGCTNIKAIIETNQLIIQDYWTITELSNFIVSKKCYAAAPGHHDDITMGLVLFGWLVMQPMFKQLTDLDMRKTIQGQPRDKYDEQMLPFGFSGNDLTPDIFVDSEGTKWQYVDDMYVRMHQQQKFWNNLSYTIHQDDEDEPIEGTRKGHVF